MWFTVEIWLRSGIKIVKDVYVKASREEINERVKVMQAEIDRSFKDETIIGTLRFENLLVRVADISVISFEVDGEPVLIG